MSAFRPDDSPRNAMPKTDVVFNINLAAASSKMGTVIDDIVSSCADAGLLVAGIPPFLDLEREKNRETLNTALKHVVASHLIAGKQVAFAAMDRLTTHHLNFTDGILPTDEGYKHIAEVWYGAIKSVGAKGWIKAPTHTSIQPELPDGRLIEAWTPSQLAVHVVLVLGVPRSRRVGHSSADL
ncbi:MAG: hypothetical protein Q9184_002460 [Pyrenodesmia sp. 2 TL-2023]